MPVTDAKRRELKRNQLRWTRIELEIAREKGHGVNFTAYMEVEEYEPTLVEDELKQACVELNVLNNMIENIQEYSAPLDGYTTRKATLHKQVEIIHSLIRPRAALDLLMTKHGATSVEQLKGLV